VFGLKERFKQGFTLTELVIILLLLGLISGIGIGFGPPIVEKAHIKNANANLSVMALNAQDGISVCGTISSDELGDEDMRESYFEELDRLYFRAPLDLDGMVYVNHSTGSAEDDYYFGPEYDGVVLETRGYKDPWGEEYRVYYLVSSLDEHCLILFASAGGDFKFSDAAGEGYVGFDLREEVGDDLVQTLNVGG